MKFLLIRSSCSISDPKPKGFVAKEEDYVRIDERKFKSPEEYNATYGPPWEARGFGHTKTRGGIRRYFNERRFFVEIKDLDDLIKFVKKNGPVVIDEAYYDKGNFEIEIYDTYRE